MAIGVEKKMTKNQILAGLPERGLLRHLLRQPGLGIEAAAERYFSTIAGEADPAPSRRCWPAWWRTRSPTTRSPTRRRRSARRNVVLARMAQLHDITEAHAVAVGKQAARAARSTPLQTGCTSASAKSAAFFCDYVVVADEAGQRLLQGLEHRSTAAAA